MRSRIVVIGLVLLAVVLVLAGTAWRTRAVRRMRTELDQARRDLQAGLRWLALERLTRLARQWPDDDEVALQLGQCELACGFLNEALATSARVSETSPRAPLAALRTRWPDHSAWAVQRERTGPHQGAPPAVGRERRPPPPVDSTVLPGGPIR